jgi:hypothetical protein
MITPMPGRRGSGGRRELVLGTHPVDDARERPQQRLADDRLGGQPVVGTRRAQQALVGIDLEVGAATDRQTDVALGGLPEALDQAQEPRPMRGPVALVLELGGDVEVLVEVAPLGGGLEHPHQLAHPLEADIVDGRGSQPGRESLDAAADGLDLLDVLDVEGRHDRAATWLLPDEPVALETHEGRPDGHGADAQPVGDLRQTQRTAGLHAVEDLLPEGLVDLLLGALDEQRRGPHHLDRHPVGWLRQRPDPGSSEPVALPSVAGVPSSGQPLEASTGRAPPAG